MTEEAFLDLKLDDAEVTELRFGWSFGIVIDPVDGEAALLIIESPFVLHSGSSSSADIVPGKWNDAPLEDLISLLNRAVARITAGPAGDLSLLFKDGASVIARGGREFEAWQFSSSRVAAWGLSNGDVAVSERNE